MTDMSKYGFFIVVCVHEDGKKSLTYTYNEQWDEHSAQFASEKAAQSFVKYCQEKAIERGYKVSYYSKYVSWSMYD